MSEPRSAGWKLEVPGYIVGGILQGVSMFVRERQRFGQGVPASVLASHRWLTIMASVGHETEKTPKVLEDFDLIDGPTAARIIGVSPRHVQRIRNDLGGVLPAGSRTYVFDRRQVIEYAESYLADLRMSADGHEKRSA